MSVRRSQGAGWTLRSYPSVIPVNICVRLTTCWPLKRSSKVVSRAFTQYLLAGGLLIQTAIFDIAPAFAPVELANTSRSELVPQTELDLPVVGPGTGDLSE